MEKLLQNNHSLIYYRAHAEEITTKHIGLRGSHREVEKIQNEKFHQWFRGHIMQIERVDGIHSLKDGIRCLACVPVEAAKRYRAFNGREFRFRPKRFDGETQIVE